MPCITEKPSRSFQKHLEMMLCYTCSLLNPEQIEYFGDNSGWIDLRQWYIEHLMQDLQEIKNIKTDEIPDIDARNLLGLNTMSVFFDKEKVIETYKNHCIKELNRMGMNVQIEDWGISCCPFIEVK